jgi:hypothetical protein
MQIEVLTFAVVVAALVCVAVARVQDRLCESRCIGGAPTLHQRVEDRLVVRAVRLLARRPALPVRNQAQHKVLRAPQAVVVAAVVTPVAIDRVQAAAREVGAMVEPAERDAVTDASAQPVHQPHRPQPLATLSALELQLRVLVPAVIEAFAPVQVRHRLAPALVPIGRAAQRRVYREVLFDVTDASQVLQHADEAVVGDAGGVGRPDGVGEAFARGPASQTRQLVTLPGARFRCPDGPELEPRQIVLDLGELRPYAGSCGDIGCT